MFIPVKVAGSYVNYGLSNMSPRGLSNLKLRVSFDLQGAWSFQAGYKVTGTHVYLPMPML
jgi:hypothetical protein